MKISLSRKGFDSTYGGIPSPILPDGRMVSIPILDKRAVKTYEDISWSPGRSMGALIRELSPPRVKPDHFAHLDPDLDFGALPRPSGWRPVFGQEGNAQSHLAKKGMGPGDLFLYFGWFRQAEVAGGRLRFVREAPDLRRMMTCSTI